MAKSLIIVESPAKTKSLKSFLGPGYQVMASMGHVRDLPKTRLGVRVDHDFAPTYVQIPGRKEILESLRKAVQHVDQVYLASDPDREG
ncbi:MAG: type I DNA topoisomerase, partial [Armatimonadetes bacterium]|nr:type I DNA topoisomerase [Armatimonadota bacterium]